MAPEQDSDLYADLYGDDEEEINNEETEPSPRATTSQTTSSTLPARIVTDGGDKSLTPIKPLQTATSSNSYASQVAQQFRSYQTTQQTRPETASPASSPATPSAIPTYQTVSPVLTTTMPTQHLTTVRPSEMKDEGKMFIGGLNWDTDDDTLRDYMTQFGPVDACTIMRDPTGRSRGFAFLRFEEAESVDAVMTHGQHILDGKVIDPKRAVPRQEYLKHARVFVGGLPPSVTSASLRESFSQYGEVVDCMVMLDRETNRSKGFGFVTYNDASGMEGCLAAAPIELDGKQIEVKEATPRNAQHRQGGVRNPVESEQQNMNTQETQASTLVAGNTMNNFNPGQMAQLYSRMMQNMGMGMGMGGMGMGGMGGMMNPMMMGAMGPMGGMNGMNMGMMNPMAMGYGMNMPRAGMQTTVTGGSARGGRGGLVGGTGGPSRMVNRGANHFHPYAR